MHKLFPFPVNDNSTSQPFKSAEYALQKINRQIKILHALLTLDVIFFDELSQISAQQLSAIGIVLRKVRDSQTPFGGVLILGTMDHTQIQPINQLPFLTSSLVLTCFNAIELQHLVRAHQDLEFQRIQQITRMNPFELSQDKSIKE